MKKLFILLVLFVVPFAHGATTNAHPERATVDRLDVSIPRTEYDAAQQVLVDDTGLDWSLVGTNAATYVNRAALMFDGIGDYIDFGTDYVLAGKSGCVVTFTCSFFFVYDGTAQIIFGRSGAGGSSDTDYGLLILSTGEINFYGTDLRFNSLGTITSNAVHTIVVTEDLDNKTTAVTLDNNAKTTRSYTTKYSSTGSLRLGMTSVGGLTSFSRISNFSIVDNQGINYVYDFEDGSGAICYDSGGGGNHGTITSTSGLSTMRAGRVDGEDSPALQDGYASWTNVTDTVYVPLLADGSGYATNAVASHTLYRKAPGGLVHNGAPIDLVTYGNVTNSFEGLVALDTVQLTTNGLINAFWTGE